MLARNASFKHFFSFNLNFLTKLFWLKLFLAASYCKTSKIVTMWGSRPGSRRRGICATQQEAVQTGRRWAGLVWSTWRWSWPSGSTASVATGTWFCHCRASRWARLHFPQCFHHLFLPPKDSLLCICLGYRGQELTSRTPGHVSGGLQCGPRPFSVFKLPNHCFGGV